MEKELEGDWYDHPQRAAEVVDRFGKLIMHGDIPHNMGATALVTNAYLHTGDDRYKNWVLRYVEGWLERMKKNNGIMPDNIGPTGKIGEHRNGLWWNGVQGWNRRGGWDRMLFAVIVGVVAAVLGEIGEVAKLEPVGHAVRVRVLVLGDECGDGGGVLRDVEDEWVEGGAVAVALRNPVEGPVGEAQVAVGGLGEGGNGGILGVGCGGLDMAHGIALLDIVLVA